MSRWVTGLKMIQKHSKLQSGTKWDKVGRALKIILKRKKKYFNKEKTTKNNFQLNIYWKLLFCIKIKMFFFGKILKENDFKE